MSAAASVRWLLGPWCWLRSSATELWANASVSCHQRWHQRSAKLAPPLMARKLRRQCSAGVQDLADVADILQLPPQLPACTPGPAVLSFCVSWALSDILLQLGSDAPQAKLIQLEPLLYPPKSVHAPAPTQLMALRPMDAKIWHKTVKEELYYTDGAPVEQIWLLPTDQRAVTSSVCFSSKWHLECQERVIAVNSFTLLPINVLLGIVHCAVKTCS